MASKCVHKGCGKVFTDPSEECIYHPGPPIFHEGQKGWRCCKPRVLTFDEFLSIPPCTTGTHSVVDDTPPAATSSSAQTPELSTPPPPRNPVYLPPQTPPSQPATPAPPESEDDDPALDIPPAATCRRRGCTATYSGPPRSSPETCIFHPGHPLFHEGSKGYTCCKRRVLEFDEFMRIEGCQTKDRHLFIGSGKKRNGKAVVVDDAGEEQVESVRNDFYQTATTVIVSLYLKKIETARSSVVFSSPLSVDLDLATVDKKRHATTIPLYAPIDPEKSTYKIMGTKLELTLVKADGASWPVLRSDEKRTGEIIQVGRAGTA
ncbi:MAG: Integrin beta-1-binding protein 2 [Geoglossum umbratile]|nr:MAG: Integrin beta-1-binding protein 2 [Geoglossum umbratile]